MKFLHISDLHLGKRLYEYSLIEDQAYILNRILEIAAEEEPAGVLICGDVYDRALPPAEAVSLFDDFLWRLSKSGASIFVLCGNHDSAERLSFGSRIMEKNRIFISRSYKGTTEPIVLECGGESAEVYMLPFLRPSGVREFFEGAEAESTADAVRAALGAADLSGERPKVLMAHQFVTGAGRSDSEDVFVGDSDGVPPEVFDGFDYVALGHLHNAQDVCGGRSKIRYCGSPLKYSLSEMRAEKSVTVVDVSRGSAAVRTRGLVPLRDMKEVRGTYDSLMLSRGGGEACGDFVRVMLEDESAVPDAAARLRVRYPFLLRLEYSSELMRTAESSGGAPPEDMGEDADPVEIFDMFCRSRLGRGLSEDERRIVREAAAGAVEEAGL